MSEQIHVLQGPLENGGLSREHSTLKSRFQVNAEDPSLVAGLWATGDFYPSSAFEKKEPRRNREKTHKADTSNDSWRIGHVITWRKRNIFATKPDVPY